MVMMTRKIISKGDGCSVFSAGLRHRLLQSLGVAGTLVKDAVEQMVHWVPLVPPCGGCSWLYEVTPLVPFLLELSKHSHIADAILSFCA